MARNKKNKHTFWKRLHFKYRLSVMNENTLEEIWKIKTSIFSGILLVLVFAFALVTVTSFIIIGTPIRYYLPGYLDTEIRENALLAAVKADSLQQQLNYQEIYINNLRDIFSGERQIDSVKIVDSISVSDNDPLLQKTQLERSYTSKYEEEEKYNLSVLPPSASTPMESLIFFRPVKGIISDRFDPVNNIYGITIKTAPKETILATLEGSVISAGYDLRAGYTIQIQHKNGFISIYRNNSTLLKSTGDKVRTGEAIATIQNDLSSDKDEELFEFELWYKGDPVNPENYISF